MKTGQYSAARQDLLGQITTSLASDERFCAAWLGGSFGRGDTDDLSDLDLSLVVNPPWDETLCARSTMVAAGAPPQRLALFRRFGEPAVLHENHRNAMEGGTFTFVLYRITALVVDWTLIPKAAATRPVQSILLFDQAGIPFQQPAGPESLSERAGLASEKAAFFWMIAAVAVKALHRRDARAYYELLGMLEDILAEIRRLLANRAPQYRRRPPIPLARDRTQQIAMLRHSCKEMMSMVPSITGMGGVVPDTPMDPIDILLDLAED